MHCVTSFVSSPRRSILTLAALFIVLVSVAFCCSSSIMSVSQDICPICFEAGGEEKVHLLCVHWMHARCIGKRKRRNICCPLCGLDRHKAAVNAIAIGASLIDVLCRSRVIVYSGDEHAKHVLLVQGPNRWWGIPGGKAERQDCSSLAACAIRELHEETGLQITDATFAGVVEAEALFIARMEDLNWNGVISSWECRLRPRELCGVWWGAMTSALQDCHVHDKAKIALTILATSAPAPQLS